MKRIFVLLTACALLLCSCAALPSDWQPTRSGDHSTVQSSSRDGSASQTEKPAESLYSFETLKNGYVFSPVGKDSRVRDTLGETLYADYVILTNALFEGKKEVTIKTRDAEQFARIRQALQTYFVFNPFLRDPYYLTCTPFDFNDGKVTVYYCFEDTTLEKEEMPATDIEGYYRCVRDFSAIITGIFRDAVTDVSDKEKTAMELFTWLSKNFAYKIDRTLTVYSAFEKKIAYCSIYSGMYQFLCAQAGISCWCCSGMTGGIMADHEWNIISLRGKYYHVDVTFQSTSDPAQNPMCYFGMSEGTCLYMGHGDKNNLDMSDPLSNHEPVLECNDTYYDDLFLHLGR